MSSNQYVIELREALRFEEEQLERLRGSLASARLNELQAMNWPALVASHERSIALYKARLRDMQAE